jgi:hypothetical protein
MHTDCSCPAGEDLERLLLGTLPQADAERLERHLEHCSVCTAAARQFQVGDTLVESVRRARTLSVAEADGAHIEQLIDRLAPPRPPARPAADAVQDICALLPPAEGPGDLGHLGGYRLLEVLGVGGMGVVFRAEDTQLRRVVALKVLKPVLAASPPARERFLREARATAALEHDHVVAVYQVGEDRGLPFLTMPLLHGESLAQRLERDGRLPVAEVVRIGREVAEGLAAAHERGLIHRDVKPSNIWLEAGSSRAKVLDFGLARVADDPTALTQTGTIVGTPAYMAPEQARGETVDGRCDLFSLGCVLYQMTAGESPFHAAHVTAILHALATKQPRPPREVNPEVPSALSDLVMRLLSKNPSGRPPTAQAVGAALAAITVSAPARPPRLRRRWVFAAAAAMLLALGLVGSQYGAVALRVLTNQGQLVIEADDPDVELIVKQGGQTITIKDLKTHRTVELRAGEWQLQLAGGREGLRLSTDRLMLSRGGQRIVTVWHEQPAGRPVREVPPAGRDGGAAEVPKPRDTAGLPLIFDADFSRRPKDPKLMLDEGNAPGRKFSYLEEGEYRLLSLEARCWLSDLGDRLKPVAAFVCEVEGRVTRAGAGSWGLAVRDSDRPRLWGAAVEVQESGAGREVRLVCGEEGEKHLVPWTACPALRPITERNTLRLETTGSRLRLFVNGRHVADRTNEERRLGIFQLTIRAYEPQAEARFRRLRIWGVPAGGQSD